MPERELHEHKVNECNDLLRVKAFGEPESGGAHTTYSVDLRVEDPATGERRTKSQVILPFQSGFVREVGANGVTNEALIAILCDRLRGFQKGPYACRENALALTKLEEAAMWLGARTRDRMRRGVESTNKP
jgi:hypothetical protein